MVGEMVGMIQRIILGFVLAGLAGTSFAQDGRGKDSDSQPPGSSEEPRGEWDPPEPLPPYEPGSTIVVRVRRDAEPEPHRRQVGALMNRPRAELPCRI